MSEKSAEYANLFSSLFRQASSTATEERANLEKEIFRLRAERDQVDTEISELEIKLVSIDDDIAVALKIAAKDAGVRLELGGAAKKKNGGARQRTSSKELKELSVQILKVLPTKAGNFIALKDIEIESGLDSDKVKLGLAKLKRDKQTKSNGLRGPASGWRRV